MFANDVEDLNWTNYLRYIFLRFVLWVTRTLTINRYAPVVDMRSKNPFESGILPNPKEFEEEWPYPEEKLKFEEVNDGVKIFSASKDEQILNVVMNRLADRRATVFIYLRTLRASYVLPKNTCVDLSTEDTFAADGLKVDCVIPNRRWRISFNGLLRNTATNNEDHVRFVFVANFISNLADLRHYYSEKLLAFQLCQDSSTPLLSYITHPKEIRQQMTEIDSIVQTYSFVGKVRTTENVVGAEAHEEEVFSFGQKVRYHEKNSSPAESLGTLMAYTKNGISVYLEETKIANFAPALTSGVIVYPSMDQCRVEYVPSGIMKADNIRSSFPIGSDHLVPLQLKIVNELDNFQLINSFNSEFRERKMRVFKIELDRREGHAVYFGSNGQRTEVDLPTVPKHLISPAKLASKDTYVLNFSDEECSNANFTGGKASSLAVLTTLSNQSGKFAVAKGLAVTTNAYELFSKNSAVSKAIQELQSALKNCVDSKNLMRICDEAVKTIGQTSIPDTVKDSLKSALEKSFKNLNDVKFAVRSSAFGEDSEEMSAAGQMETFLGIRGVENVYTAVSKCWASQFSFVAIQYRRRYGQTINCPMAVCVQEMVSSEVSGVMFTVEPVSANPKFITITANYGLGESVVSAAAEPDTFILEKLSKGTKLISSTVGAKKLRTVLLDDGGTKDIIETDASTKDNRLCLNDAQLQLLGEVALEVETHYASQRDTEWAFSPEGKLFMLQARPITSAHMLDSEFEFYHEDDEGLTSNNDCLTKANVGEVLGGSVSQLSIDAMLGTFVRQQRISMSQRKGVPPSETFFSRKQFLIRQNSQVFLATWLGKMDLSKTDLLTRSLQVSLSGRVINEEIVTSSALNKQRYAVPQSSVDLSELFTILWRVQSLLNETEKFVQSSEMSLDDCRNSKEMFLKIMSLSDMHDKAFFAHYNCTRNSTLSNGFALALLAHTEGEMSSRVMSDFAKVVASCNDVVSADVPFLLNKIANQISTDYGNSFKELSPHDALNKLKTDSTISSELFAEFLETHGHRCLHEFDLASKTWSMDPIPIVKTIQSMNGSSKNDERKDVSVDELIDSLEIKLDSKKRMIFKFLVNRVRNGISFRERSKSIAILSTHKYRLLFLQLGAKLVEENRLPEVDLLFYLSASEIHQLINTRSPKIIIRAIHRKRNAFKAVKDAYPEFIAGLPFKPVNSQTAPVDITGSRQMTATPVSQGSVVATARVVLSLEDAHQIEEGDILITYATDIGWSPYFPLLSGIVTELGGLVSHGAVVAREYGLPCIVGAHGATRLFVSGEKVSLDGSKGVLRSVDDN